MPVFFSFNRYLQIGGSLNILDTAKTTSLITRIDEQSIFDMITVNPAKYLEINAGKIEKNIKLIYYFLISTQLV